MQMKALNEDGSLLCAQRGQMVGLGDREHPSAQ